MNNNINIKAIVGFAVVLLLSQGCCSIKGALGRKCQLTEKQKLEIDAYAKHLDNQKPEKQEEEQGDINEIIAKCLGHEYKKPPTAAEKKRQQENMAAFQQEILEREKAKKETQKQLVSEEKITKDSWASERQSLLEQLSEGPVYRLIATTKALMKAAEQNNDAALYQEADYKSIKTIVALNKAMAEKYSDLTSLNTAVSEEQWADVQSDIQVLETWSALIMHSDVALVLQKRLAPFLKALANVKKEIKVEAPAEAVPPQAEKSKKESGLLLTVEGAETSEQIEKAIDQLVLPEYAGTLWHDSEREVVQSMVFDLSRINTLSKIMEGALQQVVQQPQEVQENLDSLKSEPDLEPYRLQLTNASPLVNAVFKALEKQVTAYKALKKQVQRLLEDKLSSVNEKKQPEGETPIQPNPLLALVLSCFGLTYFYQGGLSIAI